MNKKDRREFIKQTATGAAGASLLQTCVTLADDNAPSSRRAETGLRRQPLHLPGLHAYAQESVTAGEAIAFRVSSSVPYQLSVCRLGPKVDDHESDVVLHTFSQAEPQSQPIYSGSFAIIEKALPADVALPALTLECWVRPWRNTGPHQGLIAQYDHPGRGGVALFIDDHGAVQFYCGDGGAVRPDQFTASDPLVLKRWQHIVATCDGRTRSLYLNGKLVRQSPHDGQVLAGHAPLLLGALLEAGEVCHTLDGDLAMPAIYSRALSADEIAARFAEKAQKLPSKEQLLGCWPLAEERGERIADVSDQERHGQIVNRGTWMIGGPSFDATAVPLYGNYVPDKDPLRGHSLRLASDDLYDCGWRKTHEFSIPADAKSGIYLGRFDFVWKGKPCVYHVTFLVRNPPDRPKSQVLVVCSTNTWRAYSGSSFAENGQTDKYWAPGGAKNCTPVAPTYCFYRNHRAEQPTYQIGLNMPWPAAGPDIKYSAPNVGYSHLMRSERFLHTWLDEAGYSYDVVSDLDLHRNPDLPKGYRTLVLNGHSEYWTAEAYDGVDRYLSDGGTAIVLSGNTMFWRVTFDPDCKVMECRKFDPEIGGREGATPGELYHTDDHRRGSLLRECGRPAWKIVGLECIGWWDPTPKDLVPYEVVAADHRLFHEPEVVGLAKGDSLGHAAEGKLPRAVGHESDVRVSQIMAITKQFPPECEVPQDPSGVEVLAHCALPGSRAISYLGDWVESPSGIRAEMIYWQRPQGGRVFHAGSIAAGWALSADPKLQALMRNVLHEFGVRPDHDNKQDESQRGTLNEERR
jgi:N,N-dimethylformamidase